MIATLTKRQPKKLSNATAQPKSVRERNERITGHVVNYCIYGTIGKSGPSEFTPFSLTEAIRGGLQVHELDDLQTALAIPLKELVPKLGLSKATLHRRKETGRLAPAVSDRVVRFARLMGKAMEVLESEENAREWLTSPQIGLGGARPLDYAETEVGAREVEDLLGRIEYGVYS